MWTIQILGGCVNVKSLKRKKKARKYKKYIFCDKFYRCNKIGFSSFHFLWQPELHYQCTIQFRRGRLHNLYENQTLIVSISIRFQNFTSCLAFYSENQCKAASVSDLSLITSEFRTMMRKKLTNSQLITIRREMSEFVFPNFPTDVLLQIGTSDVYLFNDEYDDHWPLCSIMYLSKVWCLFSPLAPQ